MNTFIYMYKYKYAWDFWDKPAKTTRCFSYVKITPIIIYSKL